MLLLYNKSSVNQRLIREYRRCKYTKENCYIVIVVTCIESPFITLKLLISIFFSRHMHNNCLVTSFAVLRVFLFFLLSNIVRLSFLPIYVTIIVSVLPSVKCLFL